MSKNILPKSNNESPIMTEFVKNSLLSEAKAQIKKANAKDRIRLIEILGMHTTDQALRDEAIVLIQKYGAFEHVKATAERMVAESWNEAEKLLPTLEAKEKLKEFAEFLIKRNK